MCPVMFTSEYNLQLKFELSPHLHILPEIAVENPHSGFLFKVIFITRASPSNFNGSLQNLVFQKKKSSENIFFEKPHFQFADFLQT